MNKRNINVGAAIILVGFCLLFFVILYRFLSIQLTGEAAGQHLAAIAEKKYLKNGVLEAKRGTIYDGNGEVIAEDTSAYTLVAVLDSSMGKGNYVEDKEKTAKALAEFIDMSEDKILGILSKKDVFQVEFGPAGKNIPLETKKEIESLDLPGITFIRSSKRFYPNGIFASHVIGFTDASDGEGRQVGQLGIEKSFNDILTGVNGKLTYNTDRWGHWIPGDQKNIEPAKDGYDIYLTLDKNIQTFVEEALNEVNAKYNPKSMVVIVAEPKTGNILALGQRPTFHPETREGLKDTWLNEAVEVSIEPGSTMKIFTVAAALEEGVLNLNEEYKSGSFKPTENSQTIRDHNYSGWGNITYLEGIQRSSNVGMAKIVRDKLGYDRFREYLTKFGFDEPTGIELPNETSGKIVYEYPIDRITTGYGQGTALTPIQLVQAATAVANDGKMMKPNIISKIVDPNTGNVIKEFEPQVAGEPISAETAKKVRETFETVITSPKGTGYGIYNIDGYTVTGKTGTANITENGRYLKGRNNYLFSFLGMSPAEDPELIVYVAVKQPNLKDTETGSDPVSYIFKQVMKKSLQYLSIQPEEQIDPKTIEIPDVSGKEVEKAIKELKELGSIPVSLGKGKTVAKQLPEPKEPLIAGEKVVLATDGEGIMPDLTGWSLRDALKAANLLELSLDVSGTGYVVEQSIPPGTAVNGGEKLEVRLEAPEETMKGEEN